MEGSFEEIKRSTMQYFLEEQFFDTLILWTYTNPSIEYADQTAQIFVTFVFLMKLKTVYN